MSRQKLREQERDILRERKKPWQPLVRIKHAEEDPKKPYWMEQFWKNNRYTVMVGFEQEGFRQILIQRTDAQPVRNWNDLQRIKSELFGTESRAVEIFPADYEVHDVAHCYSLWVMPEGLGFPLSLFLPARVEDGA